MDEKPVMLRKKKGNGSYTHGRFSLASVKTALANGWELLPNAKNENPAAKEIELQKQLNKVESEQHEGVADDKVKGKVELPEGFEQMKLKDMTEWAVSNGLVEDKYYRSKSELIEELNKNMGRE